MECDKRPDDVVLKLAAIVCKQHTKYRDVPNIKVDCTTCRNVKKGLLEGEVEYISYRKVTKITV